ncbi:hypothetical protein PHYPSEUDO_000683 [Phytophthora pseudosyringae]|uniref:Uncharacterized protein n=1 Tax=Phytophthora pseudosyringae TaxID=221518 RepID=A0A8T1VY26_9STRA|nr:hypothetical protein PHYPSEUDO_000683 [Phytophthora pseudosyringae]
MQAHGELVRKLESDLEARRTSEAELRLTVAKLWAVNCRLEAELCAANAKARQLLEQQDAQSIETAKREDGFKAFRKESERRLQVVHEQSDQLMQEKRQLNFEDLFSIRLELSESRTCLESTKHENRLLLAKNEEQSLQANTQATEIEKLSAQLTSQQQEIEAGTARSQRLLEDLSSAREQQSVMQGRIQGLERDMNRALVIRNRALNWRPKRQKTWESRLISQGTFLAWKAFSVQVGLQTAAKMARYNDDTRVRLQLTGKEAMKHCSQAKEELGSIRQACASERMQMQAVCNEICQTELPKLLRILEHQHTTQRECAERERELLRQDTERRVQKMVENHQTQLVRRKRQQHAMVQAFGAKRERELHRRTFSAWKELYLRSVVGQATHTAMVFRSQQPQLSTVEIPSPVDRREPESWAMAAAIRPIPIRVQPLQLEKQKFDECSRSPFSEVTTPIDAMWRKWRRIDTGVAGRDHKPRPSPGSPS